MFMLAKSFSGHLHALGPIQRGAQPLLAIVILLPHRAHQTHVNLKQETFDILIRNIMRLERLW